METSTNKGDGELVAHCVPNHRCHGATQDGRQSQSKAVSRSQFVQKAVVAKLERDEAHLARGLGFNDWMGLSDRLTERRMIEKRKERKSVRWLRRARCGRR